MKKDFTRIFLLLTTLSLLSLGVAIGMLLILDGWTVDIEQVKKGVIFTQIAAYISLFGLKVNIWRKEKGK